MISLGFAIFALLCVWYLLRDIREYLPRMPLMSKVLIIGAIILNSVAFIWNTLGFITKVVMS